MFRMGTTSTPGANGSGDDSTESFLLEFGTNTTVCDEQRRTYIEEIAQIEEDTGRLRESIKRETNCQTQLKQDVKHTHTECSDISRGTADQLSSAKFYSGTVAENLESVKNVLVKPTTQGNAEDESEHARDQSPAEEGENQNLWKVVKTFTEKTKSVRTLVKEESRNAKTIKADAEKATTEIRNTRNRVSSSKLQQKLKQIEQDIVLERKKEEDESNRMVALETSVQLSGANKEAHSERLNAARKRLEEIKREHEKLEEAEKKRLAEYNVAVEAAKARLVSCEGGLKTCEDRIDNFKQQISEAEETIKIKEAKLAELKAEKEKVSELSKLKEELTLQHDDAIKKEEAALKDLHDAECEAAAAAEAKMSNDEIEASEVLPGKLELPSLEKEKKNTLSLIGDIEKQILERQSETAQEISDLNEKRSVISKTMASIEEEEEALDAKRGNLVRIHEEYKENFQRETKEFSEIEKTTKEAILKLQLQAEEVEAVKLNVKIEEGTRDLFEGGSEMIQQFAKSIEKCNKSD